MAWPRRPHCGERDLTEGQRADEVTPAETIVYRSWPCRRCGKVLGTAETVFCDDAPTVWLRKKFGDDFESKAQRCGVETAGGDPPGGAGAPVPRKAPGAVSVEIRAIRPQGGGA